MEVMPAKQGTDEWLAERLGHATASNFAAILTKGRSKSQPWGDTATSLALTLAAERLTGRPAEGFRSAATDWGNEHETAAVVAYEIAQGETVETAGFIRHPLLDWVGGSPDGLIGDDGILEAKCPWTSREHVRTVWGGVMPEQHKAQVQGNLWVTGRDWCDFVSFDPRMPESCALFITRVERDAEYIQSLADRVEAFVGLVNQILGECDAQQ